MTNVERIAALRRCSYMTVAGADREDGYCKPCAYFAEDSADVTCIDRMMIDAADALEAAEKRIDGLQKLVDLNTKRCEALRKQLRESHKSYEKHINELEAQMPKGGEWEERYIEDANPMFRRRFYCSRCGDWTTYGKTRYCPNCGAKMRGEHDEQADC